MGKANYLPITEWERQSLFFFSVQVTRKNAVNKTWEKLRRKEQLSR